MKKIYTVDGTADGKLLNVINKILKLNFTQLPVTADPKHNHIIKKNCSVSKI